MVNFAHTSESNFETIDQDIHIWMDQEAIHIKAVDAHGDPVEVTGEAARRLAARLVEMADELEE